MKTKLSPATTCNQVLTQLNDYVDGELSGDLCTELEAHLDGCHDCQIILDTLRKTIYLVRYIQEDPPSLPNDVEYRLFAMLDLEEFLPEHASGRAKGRAV